MHSNALHDCRQPLYDGRQNFVIKCEHFRYCGNRDLADTAKFACPEKLRYRVQEFSTYSICLSCASRVIAD